jgi:DNA polymerase-3 subunit alpha
VESYQALWLKAYYPLEYMVATVNNGGGYYSAELYLHEARLHGGVVMSPCVNRSDALTTIVGKTIFLGFGLMKDLETVTIQELLHERQRHGPFHDLNDFVSRVAISLEQLSLLVRIGAFRFTGKSKKAVLWEAHFLLGDSKKTHPAPRLFDNPPKTFTLPQLYHYDLQDAFDELEILGFALCSPYELLREPIHLGVSKTPERDHARNSLSLRGSEADEAIPKISVPARGIASIVPIASGLSRNDSQGQHLIASDLPHLLNKRVEIIAYLVNIKYTSTHDGKRMYFGTFLDLEGQWLDTVHFPPVAKQYPFSGPGCYRIWGKVTEEFGCYSIDVSRIAKLALRSEEDAQPKLSVPNNYTGRYEQGHTAKPR